MPDTALLAQTAVTTQPSTPGGIPEGKLTFAAVNASLNSAATILLVVGLVLIKKGNRKAHQYTMVTALTVSAIFLISYLTSKALYGEVTVSQMTKGSAPGWAKGLYLFVLIPHLIAAVGMLPFIFMAVLHAYRQNWEKHKRIAKPTWYVWFYVSVSGVLVYWMLYHWLPSYAA